MAFKIIGTAGHIDHGKSSLIKALTGTDPDRLSEEQERGMTIDLGFAFLSKEIAFIDVPGHEKFIKNMVAGASTVDAALLVVAADDGVMPQTREHLDILKILQIQHGLIALTKIDTVEEEWIEIVEEDIREMARGSFLQQAPIVRVSSVTGEGVASLRDALVALVQQTPSRQDRGIFWMPVDRSFTIKGYGTVVTGSILSGRVKPGDALELLPAKRTLRVRGIQTHGEPVESAGLGERAALNLMNIAKDEIQRGDVLATPEYFEPSKLFDAKLYLLRSAPRALSNRTRIRLHLGTREIMARIKLLGCDKIEPGGEAFVQLVAEEIAVAQKRDPFVIRQYSPQLTIGGGVILDANPKAHRRSDGKILDKLGSLEKFDPVEMTTTIILQSKSQPIKFNDLCKETGLEAEALTRILEELLNRQIIMRFGAKPTYFHRQNYRRLKDDLVRRLADFHEKEPLRPGIKKANLLAQSGLASSVFDRLLDDLRNEAVIRESNDVIKLSSHEIKLNPQEDKLAKEIMRILTDSNFATPPVKVLAEMTHNSRENVQKVLGALLGMGKVMRFEGDIFFPTTAVNRAGEMLLIFAKEKEEITVGEFREMLNTSRKFAMPLLGYFDDTGVTERVGDVRRIITGE